MNWELPDIQTGFRKAEEPEIKLPTSAGSWKKQESSRKTSALLTRLKPLTVWITTNCGKFFKIWDYQTTWPASCEICMQVKKQQLELDMEQQTGSRSGKDHVKAVYCHSAYLTSVQSTSWEMLGWMKHKLKIKIARRNINKAKGDVFLEVSWFFNGPVDVGNLISGSSAFSKSILMTHITMMVWSLT